MFVCFVVAAGEIVILSAYNNGEKMGKVKTVLGEIDSKDLNFTDMHEHILVDLRPYVEIYKNAFPPIDEKYLTITGENMYYLRKGYFYLSPECMRLSDTDLAIKEVGYFKAAGGSTILEVSPSGIRGDIREIQKISKAAGVNVIASAGLYADKFWPKSCADMDIAHLVKYIEDEINVGIDGTDIKAGHVKIACNSLNDNEIIALKAGAVAAKETGLSMQIHTGGWTGDNFLDTNDTSKMIDMILNEGASPERIIACHMDSFIKEYDALKIIKYHDASAKLNLDPVRKILDTGVNIVFDFFGETCGYEAAGILNPTDYDRIYALLKLFELGYSKQIVLGCDLYVKIYYRHYGGNGYLRVLDYVVPMLKRSGAKKEDIDNVTINNPARLLCAIRV
ncbi:MAG: hypothetical protein LBQ37_03145 [Elusimicrobiota bacterium]|jgi:phosphotriesterase-related protein|nr:hypothetical protein [Elusimicrobiota bacterium]